MQSEHVNELFTALSKAQAEIKPAVKDAKNSFFKSKYSDLPSVWSACQEPLTKNGLSVMQTFDTVEGKDYLITTLGHTSGQWIKSKCPILCNDTKPQSYGSACSYARRYALAAICGVVSDDDDDGEAAMGRGQSQPEVISAEQKKVLNDLMDKLPKETQEGVRKWVNDSGFEAMNKVTTDFYGKLYARLKKTVDTQGEALPY